MLPGFRILFAIVLLSVSVLVFGVGAAAFLRAAHDNLASTPAYRPIETAYAPRIEVMSRSETLSMMRVQTPAELGVQTLRAEQPASLSVSPRDDRAPADVPPTVDSMPVIEAPAPAVEPQKANEITTASVPAEPARSAPVSPATTINVPVAAAPESLPAAPVTETAPTPEKTGPEMPAQDSLTPSDRSDAHTAGPLAALQTPAPTVEKLPVNTAPLPAATPVVPATSPAVVSTPKPDQVAALAEPASPAQAALPPNAVRLPKPRIDPKVIETQQKEERARQQRAARAQAEARLRARRVANARARTAAAQTRTVDPFAPTLFQQPAAAR